MPAVIGEDHVLQYRGSNHFRTRLLLATLSSKPVRIIDIRSTAEEPGLKEFEVCLIRLLDKVTNGSRVELSQTGTELFYRPGVLIGGHIQHDCCIQRGIGYYLEILLALGPFCKEPLNVTLRGITQCDGDVSVDRIKAAAFPILLKFILVDDGLSLKTIKRGAPPTGGGEVHFTCPVRRLLKPLLWEQWGLVKRIRGVVYALRVSPAIANRMVESSKGVMLNFLPDVYINTDHCRGAAAGKCPGFGISLVAETDSGSYYCYESTSVVPGPGIENSLPEDLGKHCALGLLDEIHRGGVVDSAFQWLLLLWMALGQKDVSKCIIGCLSDYTVGFLQHLREFFGSMFQLKIHNEDDSEDNDDDEEKQSQKIVATCIGIGFSNINKKLL